MDRLHKAKIPYGISFTVREHNQDHLSDPETLKFFNDNGAVVALFFPYGPANGWYKGVMMTSKERAAFDERIKHIQDETPMVLINYVDRLKYAGCAAGRGHFYVRSSGEVLPCFTTSFSMGNVKETPLEQIITSPAARQFRELHEEGGNACLVLNLPHRIMDLARQQNLPQTDPTVANVARLIADDPLYRQEYHAGPK